MTHRSRSHVLEDLSRDALSRLLTGPLGWVVRDIPIDYGIDVEVEVFDDGVATGLTFKVQLKGMEAPDHLGPYRDITVDHLRYWSSLDVPVLLVAYDDSSGQVFGRWIHSLDLGFKVGQKTKRIRFSPEDQILEGDQRLLKVVEAVRRLKSGHFGRPYPVRFDVGARHLVYDFFSIARSLGLDDYVRHDRDDFAFTISIYPDRVRVALPADVGSFSLHPKPVVSAEDLLRDSLALLSCLLVRLNRYGEAVQIMRRVVGNCRAVVSPDVALEVATAAYQVGDSDLLAQLILEAFRLSAFDAGQIYLMVLRQMPERAWFDSARGALESEIERCVVEALEKGSPQEAAFWAYNFAQLLFQKEEREGARGWIRRALDLDPGGYGSRPEPHRLLGAIAWFGGKMLESVAAYRAAVEIGGIQVAGSALADSLMHAGLYMEARQVISRVLDGGSDNWRDWFVQAIVTELVDDLGLPEQVRRDYPAEGTVLSGRTLPELEEFLKSGDGLNGDVWLARCLEHPVERLTTLMAGAFLSDYPPLMAVAVVEMIAVNNAEGGFEGVRDNLSRLLHDQPEVLAVLRSAELPLLGVAELVEELGLRSLELEPRLPGVQLVDENNIVRSD